MSSVNKNITINSSGKTLPYDRYFQECIGSCHAYLALREDYREHLRLVQKEIGFKRLRFHGLFCEDVGICLKRGGKILPYNFQNIDKIFDFLLSVNIRPFVELGFMPGALAKTNERLCFVYEGYISPPRDYTEWQALIQACLRHWIERYGLSEVLTWYFEVWNEPDLQGAFFSGSREDYFLLYEMTARAVKSVDERLMTGGPATSKNLWISEFIDYCSRKNVPVDFVSTHHYCSEIALSVDGKGDFAYRGQKIMAGEVDSTVKKVKASALPNLEILYTEWNTTPIHVDSFGKDSEFTAAFVLETVRSNSHKIKAYSFWTFSDIFEESGPAAAPFAGRYGLVNIYGIKKPVFHAWLALANMYDSEIETAEKSLIVTKTYSGNIRLVSWLLTEPLKTDFTGEDWLIPEEQKEENITLENINGIYRVKAWTVNNKSGNAFRAWQNMGKPQYPSKEQIEMLHKDSDPKTFKDEIVNCTGELALVHTLTQNSFIYYDIEKIRM